MSYLEELLPEFRKGAKIRNKKWLPNSYIYKDGSSGFIFTDKNEYYTLSNNDIIFGEWEIYQEPIDWDYIIKNQCLCWFWDVAEEHASGGFLEEITLNGSFKKNSGLVYANCRPVRRAEVTFYEDRKDAI